MNEITNVSGVLKQIDGTNDSTTEINFFQFSSRFLKLVKFIFNSFMTESLSHRNQFIDLLYRFLGTSVMKELQTLDFSAKKDNPVSSPEKDSTYYTLCPQND